MIENTELWVTIWFPIIFWIADQFQLNFAQSILKQSFLLVNEILNVNLTDKQK